MNNHLLRNKKIAIIGAGPVGLTMARLLQQSGIDVIVYERDKDAEARIWGGTLDLHKSSGQEVMKRAGLLEAYYAMSIPMGRVVADEQGNVLFTRIPTPEEQHDNPEINRNDLRTLLLNSLANNTVVWNRKFAGLEEHNGRWLLHFDNEMSETADVVIGASGGMSTVRKYVTNAEVEYTGTFIIQGDVSEPATKCPEFYRLCDNKILMTANNGNMLVANPRNGNVLSYSVIFKKPGEWAYDGELNFQNPESIAALLSRRLDHWQECYKQLFRSTSFFVGLPTRKLSLDKAWTNDRPLPVTLIGDAAHLMPPFAGQGVNIGLVDTMILSDKLSNGKFRTIMDAVGAYEKEMIVYAREAQLQSHKNEIEMHDPNFSFTNRFMD